MSRDAKELLTGESLGAVFEEFGLEIAAAVRERLEELRDAYEERLRRRGEEWRKEADALAERVRKAEAALEELRARLKSPRARRARKASGEDAPELPLTAEHPSGLAADLAARGFEVIDRRASGGSLWVVGDAAALRPVIALLRRQGVTFRFAPRGGRATGGRAAWLTTSSR